MPNSFCYMPGDNNSPNGDAPTYTLGERNYVRNNPHTVTEKPASSPSQASLNLIEYENNISLCADIPQLLVVAILSHFNTGH